MLLVMPHADPSRTYQPKPKRPLVPRRSKAPAVGITVPFEYFRRHIYVTVSLQGKPGFIFMLDSGANRNILNLRTSKLLGMQPLGLSRKIERLLQVQRRRAGLRLIDRQLNFLAIRFE